MATSTNSYHNNNTIKSQSNLSPIINAPNPTHNNNNLLNNHKKNNLSQLNTN
jgi:hypothetical protein